MASEAKTENGADGSGKDEREPSKGTDNADQDTSKGQDNEQEADKGKADDASKHPKDSTENAAEPTDQTPDGLDKKSPEKSKSRPPSATQQTRAESSVGEKANADETNTRPASTAPSDPPARSVTPGGRKTAEEDKASTSMPATPTDTKNPGAMSPSLASPRNVVSPPLTARTMELPQDGPCDICPQENKTTKAEFVCHGCVQRFCVRCAKRHLDTPVFANHEVDPMTSDNQMKALQELSCRGHPQRKLEFFCQGCQEAACGLCISFNHGGKQHQIGRVENLPSNRHVLLSRYEQVIRGETMSPSKQAATPDQVRPLPFLLWKRESVQNVGTQDEEPAHLCGPSDITFLPRGQVIVADRLKQSVKYFDENGENAMVVLEKLAPLRVCCTASGRIAVIDDFAQGQIKLIQSEQFIKKMQETNSLADPELDTPNGRRAAADGKSEQGVGVDNAHNTEGAQEENSEQSKDIPDNGQKNKDVTKPHNATSRQSDRASLASNQSTRSHGRRNKMDQDIFRDLSIVINSIDPQDTWKPRDMKRPWAIAVNKYGQWLVSEYEQYVRSSVTVYDSDGSLVRSFGGIGDKDYQFEWPSYLASDSRGRIVVSDYYNHTVKIFDQRGNFVSKLGKGWGKKDGHLTFPKGVCVDSDDRILVVDSGNNRICEFAPDGSFVRNLLTQADGIVEPEGIAFVEVLEDNEEAEQGKDGKITAHGSSNSQKGAQRDTEQRATSQMGSSGCSSQRRLAVTLCKGHEYSALLVYGLDLAES